MIHVMAATGLGGTAMSASVVGYDAIAVLEEEQHLRVPIIRRQRPAVAEHNGLTFAPVLVINLGSVFCCDSTHISSCPIHITPRGRKLKINRLMKFAGLNAILISLHHRPERAPRH